MKIVWNVDSNKKSVDKFSDIPPNVVFIDASGAVGIRLGVMFGRNDGILWFLGPDIDEGNLKFDVTQSVVFPVILRHDISLMLFNHEG